MTMTRSSDARSSSMTRPTDAELQGKAAELDKLMKKKYSEYVATRSTNSYKEAKKAAASLAKIGQLADQWYPIFKLPKPRAVAQGPQKQIPGQVTPTPSESSTPAFQPSTDDQQTAVTEAITTVMTPMPDGTQVAMPVVDEEQLSTASSSSSSMTKPLLILGGLAIVGAGVYMWSRSR